MIKKKAIFILILIFLVVLIPLASAKVLVIQNGISLNNTEEVSPNLKESESEQLLSTDGLEEDITLDISTNTVSDSLVGLSLDNQAEEKARRINESFSSILLGKSTIYIDEDIVELNILNMWYDKNTGSLAFNLTGEVNGKEKLIHNPYKIYNPPLYNYISENEVKEVPDDTVLESIATLVITFPDGKATFDGIDPTSTIYPKFDAYLTNTTKGIATSVMLLSPGSTIANATPAVVDVTRNATSGYVDKLGRYAVNFNTSSIGSAYVNSSVTNVSLQLRGTARANSAGALSIGVTGYNPSSNSTIVSTDFNKNLTTSLSKNITYGSWSTGAYNIFYFKSEGLTYFDKTNYTNLMARLDEDINSTLPSGTSVQTSSFSFRSQAYTGTSQDPILVVVYEEGASIPNATFTKNITSFIGGTSVQFNDTSSGAPTSWAWNFTNITGNNTPVTFSTTNNTVQFFGVGNYSIRLNASNSFGYNISPQNSWVNISGMVGTITSNITQVYTNQTIQFNVTANTSTTYLWDFGDSSTSSTQNATKYYTIPGVYNISCNVSSASDYKILYYNDTILIGPNITYVGGDMLVKYEIPGITNITYPSNVSNMRYLIVAGGGGGGGLNYTNSYTGGGGAGGVLYNDIYTNTSGYIFNIKVGLGGDKGEVKSFLSGAIYKNGTGIEGNNSYISDLVAFGGGGGGSIYYTGSDVVVNGTNGGSGGGASLAIGSKVSYGGLNLSNQGTLGHDGSLAGFAHSGAGGGSNLTFIANLSPGIDGGNPFVSNITGSSIKYAQGGSGFNASSTYFTYLYYGSGGSGNTYPTAGQVGRNGTVVIRFNFTSAVPPVASFTTNITSGSSVLPVLFTDTSTNSPTSWIWNFTNVTGNNTPITFSTSQNPTQSFGVGNFSIRLNATNGYGSNISTQTTFINVTDISIIYPVFSNATANITKIQEGRDTVQFTDYSNNTPTSWNWSFKDGTLSTSQNPNHTWSHFGVFTVNLTATNANTSAIYPNFTVINVTESMKTNMSMNYTKIAQKRDTIGFVDNSTNATIFDWSFGDGTANITTMNANHTYSSFGLYTIMHNASSDVSFNKTTFVNQINVTETMKTNMSANITKIQEGLDTVQFTDISTNASIWDWGFNDGGTNSTLQSPNHTWNHFGQFTVMHNASSDVSFNKTTFVSWINVTESMKTNMTTNITSCTSPCVVSISDASTNASIFNTSIGTNFSVANPAVFTLTGVGSYSVTHNASSDVSYNSTTFTNWITVIAGELPIANYTTNKTSGTEPQAVLFTDTTKGINTTKNVSYGDGTWYNTTSWVNQQKTYSVFGNYSTYMIAGNLNGTNTSVPYWLNFTESMKVNMTMNLTKIEEDKDTILFSDASTNATIFDWGWNDGTANSTTQNPNHTFSRFGIYSIYHNASSSTSFNKTTFVNQINVTEKMKTNMSVNITKLEQKKDTFGFTDISTNASLFNWSFGDGTYSSLQSPNHTYSGIGLYTVSHNASSDVSYNTTTFVNWVNSTERMKVNMTTNITLCTSPCVVQISDASTNASIFNTSIGTNFSVANPAVFTLTGVGSYSVTHNASSDVSYNSTTFTNWITVIAGDPPVANYTVNITTGTEPLPVLFHDTTKGPNTSKNLSYGDGTWYNTTSFTDQVKTYNHFGNYSTYMMATNLNGTNITSPMVWINVTESMKTNMSANVTSGFTPLSVQFNSLSTNATSWNWTFGAANFSNSENPVYTFTGAGTYTVKLNASSSTSFNTTTFTNWITVTTPPPPIVNFTYNSSGGYIGSPVQFISDSNSFIIDYNWSLGDGNFSTSQNPLFVYNKIGVYSVSLNVTNASGYNSTTKTNIITISDYPILFDDFSANITKIQENVDTVQFTESASNETSYLWDFGDSQSSSAANPNHTYKHFGLKTVSLTVYSPYRTNVTTKNNYINVTEHIVADFTSNVTGGKQNAQVQFTDLTNNASGWTWNFGDGGSSSSKNPVHQYTKFGTFTVSLTATSDTDSSVVTKTGYITITELMIADFSGVPTSGDKPLSVTFTDASRNATSWYYNFGDGVGAWTQNPTHVYTTAGTYTVSLTADSATDSNTTMKVNYITVTNPPTADFTYTNPYGPVPHTVTFTDTSNYVATNWAWDFGDGHTSNLQNPSNSYAYYGTFTVSLHAWNGVANDIETKSITVDYKAPDQPYIFEPVCVNCSIETNASTGMYTSKMFGNALLTENLSIWDLAVGSYSPAGDAMVNWTGIEDAWWWIFAIIGFLWIFGIWVKTGSAAYAALATIPISSGLYILTPSIVMVLIVSIVSFGIAGAIYKMFISDG